MQLDDILAEVLAPEGVDSSASNDIASSSASGNISSAAHPSSAGEAPAQATAAAQRGAGGFIPPTAPGPHFGEPMTEDEKKDILEAAAGVFPGSEIQDDAAYRDFCSGLKRKFGHLTQDERAEIGFRSLANIINIGNARQQGIARYCWRKMEEAWTAHIARTAAK